VSEPESQAPLETDPEGYAPSVARRMAFYQRAGGIVTPIMTAVVAFLMGGIVVLSTGHNPWRTYKAIFEGSGLNWFFHPGNHSIHIPFTHTHVWFLWDTNTNHTAAYNLTQTLLTTTPLILTGLAVAFAFRCGLFNIGGQGQYLMGTIVGVYIGSRFTDMGHLPHVLFAGRLSEEKGILEFLDATAGMRRVIVGDGPLRPRVSEAAGFVPPAEVGAYYERSAVVCVPSRREGYGFTAREAMAYGRPVVATRAGGLADLGDGAELVDSTSLREAIARLLGDSELRAQMGARARTNAETHFGLAASAEALVAVYRQALDA